MTRQYSRPYAPNPIDAGQTVAQLRHVLELVERIAARPAAGDSLDSLLDENARITAAYENAPAIVQRRFDSLTADTAGWAATGVQALLTGGDAGVAPPRAAAGALADQLSRALGRIVDLLDLQPE